jgi:hypothetical protein
MAPSSPLVVKMVGMERRQLSWQRGPLSGRHITSNISNINWLLTTRRACSEASVLSVEGRFLSLTKGKNIRLHKSASIPAASIKNTTEKVLPCKYLQTARLTAIIISL